MQGKEIVITGLQPWEIEIGSNCKNIAVEFSKNNRVLYVNPPLDRFTAFRKKIKKSKSKVIEERLIEVKKNLWVLYPQNRIESINQLPFDLLFDILNKRNNRIIANEIEEAISFLKFKNFVHFCDSDMFRSFYLKDFLNPSLYIYYTRDNLLAVDYWKRQGKRVEPLHMKKADLVVANSTYLAKLASYHNPNSYFVGQGCDLSAFRPENANTTPMDISEIPKPIIGYIGALKTLRLNINTIQYIAESKPEWSIVLIGPEDDDFKASNLHNLSNVRFLGSKDEKLLPDYLMAFDVAINPQIVNEVTIGNYPRKIDEYLAMGKPVVATQTEAMDYFKEYTSLANTNAEWVECIDMELRSDNEQLRKSRMVFAAQHTWEKNVDEIYKQLSRTERNEY